MLSESSETEVDNFPAQPLAVAPVLKTLRTSKAFGPLPSPRKSDPTKLGLDHRFTALFKLQHVCLVLLVGICFYLAVVAVLAFSQTIAKVSSGIHTAATGASYMAVCGII